MGSLRSSRCDARQDKTGNGKKRKRNVRRERVSFRGRIKCIEKRLFRCRCGFFDQGGALPACPRVVLRSRNLIGRKLRGVSADWLAQEGAFDSPARTLSTRQSLALLVAPFAAAAFVRRSRYSNSRSRFLHHLQRATTGYRLPFNSFFSFFFLFLYFLLSSTA